MEKVIRWGRGNLCNVIYPINYTCTSIYKLIKLLVEFLRYGYSVTMKTIEKKIAIALHESTLLAGIIKSL